MLRTLGRRYRHHARILSIFTILAALAIPSHAATFQLGALIQVGFAATGASLGAGASSGSISVNGNGAAFQNNAPVAFQIEYQKSTNTMEVRLYQGATATGAYSSVDYNPVGGNLVAANATWTIPAGSFFVTAGSAATKQTSISVSGLALTGISGAVNILQPIQQTTLTALKAPNSATSVTITQTQDIVFQGDSTGSWILSGTLNLTGLNGAGGATGADLQFGFSGGAAGAEVPELSTISFIGAGLIALGLHGRRRNLKA